MSKPLHFVFLVPVLALGLSSETGALALDGGASHPYRVERIGFLPDFGFGWAVQAQSGGEAGEPPGKGTPLESPGLMRVIALTFFLFFVFRVLKIWVTEMKESES